MPFVVTIITVMGRAKSTEAGRYALRATSPLRRGSRRHIDVCEYPGRPQRSPPLPRAWSSVVASWLVALVLVGGFGFVCRRSLLVACRSLARRRSEEEGGATFGDSIYDLKHVSKMYSLAFGQAVLPATFGGNCFYLVQAPRSLAGRFQFAAQQLFGKCAAPMLRLLHRQGEARSAALLDDA